MTVYTFLDRVGAHIRRPGLGGARLASAFAVTTAGRIRRRLLIGGRVQGVWFRDSLRREAELAGVAGTARNLADGRVEAVLEGPAEAVARLVAWCHHGPPRAEVAEVEVTDEAPRGATSFVIG